MREKDDRKKQVFELDGNVEVTVRFPAGRVRWQATHNAVSIATGDADMAAVSLQSGQKVRSTSESVPQDTDTPEIAELRKRLPADPTMGGLAGPRAVVFTSADAFKEQGIEFDEGELTPENLEAAAEAARNV